MHDTFYDRVLAPRLQVGDYVAGLGMILKVHIDWSLGLVEILLENPLRRYIYSVHRLVDIDRSRGMDPREDT